MLLFWCNHIVFHHLHLELYIGNGLSYNPSHVSLVSQDGFG